MKEPIEQQPVAGTRAGSLADPESVRRFATDVARSLRDDKCEDIVVLDVRGLSNVTDYVVIGSGTSQRQMGSALQHIEELAVENRVGRLQTNRDDQSLWLLADFVDVVVHLFEPNTRAYYDLEMLWGDATRVAWNDREQA
ncbi:MAG: ribosome silencing factor [Phycisphaerales bacterium]|nr:ribosome silencing factor [Phycisphaerales bacterium]